MSKAVHPVPARVYLDLDRTLFKTDEFMSDLLRAVQEVFGIGAVKFKAEIPHFYKLTQPGLRHYDFFAQIAAHGIAVEEADRLLTAALTGRHYVYADAQKLLGFLAATPCELRIISFGTRHYQMFKYHLAPALRHLPIDVVLHTKATFLAAQPAWPSILVDDRLTEQLPPWCDMFLLDRAATQKITKEGDGLWRINSLQVVETALTVGYNGANQKGTSDASD